MTDYIAPAVIPTRTLSLTVRKQPLIATSWVTPVVLLDGYRFQLGWGTQNLTIPADRPVHVRCEMPYLYTYGTADALLQPNQIAALEYSPPSMAGFAGEIGAPGTTTHRGTWLIWVLLGVIGFFVLGGIALAAVSSVMS